VGLEKGSEPEKNPDKKPVVYEKKKGKSKNLHREEEKKEKFLAKLGKAC